MSKKITGWMRADIDMHPMSLALSATIRANAQPDDVAATLIIHNGQPEPCFTASEVRALIQEAFEGYTREGSGIAFSYMKKISAKHGITLDPA